MYLCLGLCVLGRSSKNNFQQAVLFFPPVCDGVSLIVLCTAECSGLAAPQVSRQFSGLWLQTHGTTSGLLHEFWDLNSGWLSGLQDQQFHFLRNLPSPKHPSSIYPPDSSFVLDRLGSYQFLICMCACVYNACRHTVTRVSVVMHIL